MKSLIKKLLKEGLTGLRFWKRPITLFMDSSSTSYNYGDDYGSGSISSNSYSTPENKKITTNVTPVMSGDNPKLKELFPEDELYDIFYDEIRDDNVIIICTEGILVNVSNYDGDCDGESSSFGVKMSTKNPNWPIIKEKIKSVLTQEDINDALKKLGKVKSDCEWVKTREIPIKKRIKADSFTTVSGNDLDGSFIIEQHGKFGYTYYRGNKLYVRIPIIFDKMKYFESKETIVGIKNGYAYSFSRGWKTKLIKKEKTSDIIDEMKNVYQRAVDKGSYNDSFLEWVYDLDLYDLYRFYK